MEKLLKLPYAVFNDWNLLQQFLERRGNPRYELVGDVDLSYREDIIDIGNLVRVDGYLILPFVSIQSFGKLQYVGGGLDLYSSSIKSLGNLVRVDGYLDLRDTPIQSLGNLEHVGERIYLSGHNGIPEKEINKFKHKIKYI